MLSIPIVNSTNFQERCFVKTRKFYKIGCMPQSRQDDRKKLFLQIKRATEALQQKMVQYEEALENQKKAELLRKKLKK